MTNKEIVLQKYPGAVCRYAKPFSKRHDLRPGWKVWRPSILGGYEGLSPHVSTPCWAWKIAAESCQQ